MKIAVHSADEASRLLQESLARAPESSDAYVPASEHPGDYLLRAHTELRTAAIAPVEVSVRPDPTARTFGPWEERNYRMFIVARTRDQVLLVNTESGLFSLGSVHPDGEVRLVGFASRDALAEWVG